jgi:predicted DsbA family dithiol-disulfide isomerase
VVGKPFLLRPDIPKEGRPRKRRPEDTSDQLSEPLRTYAEEAGLVMRRPPVTSYTMHALEATEYAKEQGAFDPFHKQLYRAYWEDGRDLGDLDVIKDAADATGLEWPELRDRLESRHYQESVTDQYQEAMGLGINGIPAFLIGNVLFTGARPYEVFKAVMGKVLEGEAPL